MSTSRLITSFGFCLLAMMACAGVLRADWTYDYADDFAAGTAEADSYRHSRFWSRGAVALSEPYLFYVEIDRNQGLAFMDRNGQLAELGYRFPVTAGQAQRSVRGMVTVDVSFPSTAEISQQVPGRLECRTSSDGTGWSATQTLPAGRRGIPVTSATGACYILFSGTRAVIDNLAVSLSSLPVTIEVPADFDTIQEAIDAAVDGDVIEVAPRVYSGPGNRDIDFQGKAITVQSAAGPQYTIIDCGGSAAAAVGGHRGFYFHEEEGSDSVLSGFTIRSGRVFGSEIPPDPLPWTPSPSHPVGGGIYCEFSSPTINNCFLQDCGAEVGGGIGVVGASPIIEDCRIEECIAGVNAGGSGGRGGAIALLRYSDATITNCILRNNAGNYDSYGVGLYCLQSTASVAGCVFSGNGDISGVRGGGAYCGGSAGDVTFRHCIFSQNRADAGAGIYAEGQRGRLSVINCTIAYNELRLTSSTAAAGIQSIGADLLLTNSILWGNTKGKAIVVTGSMLGDSVTYSDIEGGYAGMGNLNLDPLFAAPASEDYHLQSTEGRYNATAERWVTDKVQSPCIDAGNPSDSVGDEPTPNGNRINMGAYGGTKEASKGPEHVIWEVDKTGNRPGAFMRIQDAIDNASNGDTVLVWPGEYNERLVFTNQAITVQSAEDAAVLTASDYAVSFYYGESYKSVLANFVITGCGTGGIYCAGASPSLKNLTIVGNPVGIVAYDGSEPNIVNCILWYNSTTDLEGAKARYSNIQHDTPDTRLNNMQREPYFADRDRKDYHLKSEGGRWSPLLNKWVFDGVTSPCIDAGDPRDNDYQGELMPNGGRINMGAYGGTPYASKSKGG
jgi:hypothetical protein